MYIVLVCCVCGTLFIRWDIANGHATGVAVTGGECIVDVDSEGYYCLKSHADVGNSNYDDNQSDCVFTIHVAGVLDVRIFGIHGSDNLAVTTSGDTTNYQHYGGPDGVMVNPGDEVIWVTSGGGITELGFDICIV